MAATALEAAQVRRRLDPAALPFDTTADVAALHGTIGQERALDAIDFGLEVTTPGYNLFLAGTAGSGRESTILDCLERAAARRAAPDDLVYAHNFAEPGRPRALRLPGRVARRRRGVPRRQRAPPCRGPVARLRRPAARLRALGGRRDHRGGATPCVAPGARRAAWPAGG